MSSGLCGVVDWWTGFKGGVDVDVGVDVSLLKDLLMNVFVGSIKGLSCSCYAFDTFERSKYVIMVCFKWQWLSFPQCSSVLLQI